MKSLQFHSFTLSSVLLALMSFAPTTMVGQSITHDVTLPPEASWCSDSMITSLFAAINAARAQNGVAALKMDSLGMKDADMRAIQFSQYMATATPANFNPHVGYDTTAQSLGYLLVSENLAWVSLDPNYVVYGWGQDYLHRAALLSTYANVGGVSCVYANGGYPYWTYEPGYSQQVQSSPPPTTNPIPASPVPTSNPGTSSGSVPSLDSEQTSFLSLINAFRAQNGAGPLQVSVTLQNSSQWMSTDLATHSYFGHTDSLGRDSGARISSFGYTHTWGENIAAGYSDAQNTLNQWASACDPDGSGRCTYAHRNNMLNPSFSAIGIGRAYSGNSSYGWYWTTDFGSYLDQPLTASPTPAPNPSPTPAPPPSPSPAPSLPVISTFVITPSTITTSQPVRLSWSVSGATTVSVDNGIGEAPATASTLVSPPRTTTYQLTATNAAGSVTASVTLTVNVVVRDVLPPTAPNITSAVVKSSTEVDLAWSASTDNTGVAGYAIFRNGSSIGTVAGTTLTYADMNATPNTAYVYAIQAYDAAGNVATGNSIQVTTPGAVVSAPCPGPAVGAFTGCYYNNLNLAGTPVLITTDSQINFNWPSGTPNASISPHQFSVRWQGYLNFDQGNYTFTATGSDDARVYIDGTLVFYRWGAQAFQVYSAARAMSPGSHLVVVEYYERTSTTGAHLSWQKVS